MVAVKEWTKIDPKDAKTISLTTSWSKLYKTNVLPLKQFKEEEVIEHIPPPTLKEGTPTRVMLRDLTILNPGESRNQRIRLP